MAKQPVVAFRSDDCISEFVPSVKPVIQNGVKANLLRIKTMLSGCVRRQKRRQTGEVCIPRKSREEESRLEFQRFLYW
jgi:hypothetical protein